MPVGLRLLSHPRLEDRADGSPELFVGIFWERVACLFLKVFFIFDDQIAPAGSGHFGIVFHAEPFLHGPQACFKLILRQSDHHAGIHLYETPVSIVSKALVLCRPREARNRLIVQAEIQNCLHHSGHGARRTRAHADKQRVTRISQLLSREFFQTLKILFHFGPQIFGIFAVMLKVIVASLGSDRESGRNRQSDASHFRQAGALAAQQILHLAVAFSLLCPEEIDVFHVCLELAICSPRSVPCPRHEIRCANFCRRANSSYFTSLRHPPNYFPARFC